MSISKAENELVEKGFVSYLPVIVALCLVCGICGAMLTGAPGIFYPVISADLGVQTAEISAWMALCLISCALLSPVCGRLVEKVDMRILIVVAAIVEAAGFAGFSVSTAPWMFWVIGIVMGFPAVVVLGMATATLINGWFKRFVGMIIGVCTAFAGIGGAIWLMVGQMIIDTEGWRAAYLVFAAIIVVVIVPVTLLCVRTSPSSRGLLPFGTAWSLEKAQGNAEAAEPKSVDPSTGTKSLPFLMVIIFCFLVSMVCMMNGYFPKYVNWVNEQAAAGAATSAFITGAMLASICQVGAAAGKIGLGAFSDFSVGTAVAVLSGAGALGTALIWLFPSSVLMPVGGFIFGFFVAGVLVLSPMLIRCVFGEGRHYPVFFGRVNMFIQFGGAAGNLVWPLLADNCGGFNAVFGVALVCIVVVLLAGLAAYRMRDALPRS